MRKSSSKVEFLAMATFLLVTALVLTNGFASRISAKSEDVDVYMKLEPVGDVLDKILTDYVREPEIDKLVEGSLIGMMNSLDKHSSYISAESFEAMQRETKGEFEGIGVSIKLDDEKRIIVQQPIADSPASKAGIRSGDLIAKIDGAQTSGMSLEDAAKRIRGPKGTVVHLTLVRMKSEKTGQEETEVIELDVKRGNIPIESIKEARVLADGVGYVRISDFKESTAHDLGKNLNEMLKQGMKSLVLDLRWNPGGLLPSSKEVCEFFLPKGSLVTYTQGRKKDAPSPESMKLYTENEPLLPKEFPIIVLTNEMTASCSEIVTGAMQFYQRTIVVGAKTYGKGSVQTIIPLARPAGAALRLTTALYYTPAEVTIDSAGIKPDVEVAMEEKESFKLLEQMYKSYEDDPKKVNEQNHGTVTGAAAAPELMEDVQLKRAVELLKEDPSWENLIKKYHKDVHETQVAAEKNSLDGKEDAAKPADAQKPADGSQSPGSDGQMRKIDPPVIFVPAPEKK